MTEDYEESIRNIRNVVSELILWAAGEGLGFDEGEKLMRRLYSGSMICNNEAKED